MANAIPNGILCCAGADLIHSEISSDQAIPIFSVTFCLIKLAKEIRGN